MILLVDCYIVWWLIDDVVVEISFVSSIRVESKCKLGRVFFDLKFMIKVFKSNFFVICYWNIIGKG